MLLSILFVYVNLQTQKNLLHSITMKIYCVRHGEAESAEVDPERGLTESGRLEVLREAEYLEKCGVKVAHILHSTKKRAQQTAEIFAASLASDQITECESLLNEENAVEPMLEMIETWTDDTMLVGHLPFMPKLVSSLVVGDSQNYPIVNFPPGGIVCLNHCDRRWVIQWILQPALVPAE